MAFTPTNRRNACLRVIPGSHRTFFFDESTAVDFQGANKHIEVNGERLGFYGYSYEPMKKDANWKPDPKDEFAFELEPGQCVIFTSRLLHGSYPNSSESDVRLGFATRFCAEQVKVYPDAKTFRMFGEERPLDRYSTVLVGGSAKLGHNVTSTPLPLGEEELAVVKPHAGPTAEARTVQPAP
jgi:non-haem Fe2+, alpha-ketoglutarate-dependent halogenase